jgi:hypothetical protein
MAAAQHRLPEQLTLSGSPLLLFLTIFIRSST